MVKKIILGVVVLVGGVLLYAATLPDTYEMEFSVSVQARPSDVYGIVSDLRRTTMWSPYEQSHPSMKRLYSGSSVGTGSVYEWEGDWRSGAGRVEILQAIEDQSLSFQMDVRSPVASRSLVDYSLERVGESTRVKLSIKGVLSYGGKILMLFNRDEAFREQIQLALNNLKKLAEQPAVARP